MGEYSPSASRAGCPKVNSLAAVKTFSEGTGILDAGVYPPAFAVCAVVLLPWLQKAITAREAAMALSAENKVVLE